MPRRSGSSGILAAIAATFAFGTSLLTPVGTASAEPEEETPRLSREGRWLVDQHGRIVLVHGQNLVWKHDPYVPPDSAEGFTAADAEWLAEHGLNGARIGTLWAGVTPDAPGKVDEGYLDDWQRVIDLLADDADLSTVKSEKLRTLVRTYPQATAGTPVDLSFDPDTGEFSYTYEPSVDPSTSSGHRIDELTEIFVSPLHYPSGAKIAVEGGRVVGEAEHNRILVEATGTGPVTVTID